MLPNGPSYEFSLVAGFVLPYLVGVLVAWPASREWGRVLRRAGVVVLCMWVTAFALGLWRGHCEPLPEYALLALGPSMGVFLCAFALGTLLDRLPARWTHRRLMRLGWALALPTAALFGFAAELALSPAVYAYSEFFGYFAGPVYDSVLYRLGDLASYRAGSAVLAFALWSARGRPLSGRRMHFAVAAYALLRFMGGRLGHRTGGDDLERLIPARVVGERCEIHYDPLATSSTSAQRTHWECERQLRALESFWSLKRRAPISVRLFANEERKQLVLGAGATDVAKPWRGEVYIEEDRFPHPTLRHELAHVLLAEAGQGPFRIAGSWGGLLPDPGRIEGFAVASAPPFPAGMTLREVAAAELESGQLPSLRTLLGAGFYGLRSESAYGTSGAFVQFLRSSYGARIALRWYSGEQLEKATGASMARLEGEFRDWLRSVPVSARGRQLVERRRSVAPTLEQRCRHCVAPALAQFGAACALDPIAAARFYNAAVALDPSLDRGGSAVARCFLRRGDLDRAGASLHEPPHMTGPIARELSEVKADLAWLRGEPLVAAAMYDALVPTALSPTEERSLKLKSWAASRPSQDQDRTAVGLVRAVLAQGREAERLWGALVSPQPSVEGQFLQAYFAGKLLLQNGAFQEAASQFAEALRHAPPFDALREEAHWSALLSRCAARDPAVALTHWEALDRVTLAQGRREELAALKELCIP